MNIYSISKPRPRSITVGGKTYVLNLSFDRVLSAIELLSSENFDDNDTLDIIYEWFVINNKKAEIEERLTVVNEIFGQLINNRNEHSSDDEQETISFSQDAGYIYAAFRQAYGIDLFEQQGKMQWWEFISLLQSLPENTRLSQIIDIRTRPVPVMTQKNYKEIQSLLKLKAQFAIKQPVNCSKAQNGWERLFAVLEKQAQ